VTMLAAVIIIVYITEPLTHLTPGTPTP
jgi:hypothetical protein